MSARRRKQRLAGFLCVLLLVTGSCVQDGRDERAESPRRSGLPRGGILKIAGVSDIDSLDPAAMYSPVSWTLARGIFRGLLTYPASEDSERRNDPVPDLAENVGSANEDNTEWTFELKDDVRYGPAVGGRNMPGVTGEEIVCEDFKYALERLFMRSVDAGYAVYYEILQGAEEFRDGGADGISGVQCPDDKTIRFSLVEPAGDWPHRMTLPAASPVPRAAARRYDAHEESDYGNHAVATGPYMVEQWRPGQGLRLVRNPHWSRASDEVREALVEEVRWRVGFDGDVAVKEVVEGDYSYAMDAVPSGPMLAHIAAHRRLKQRLINEPSPCVRYIFMNTKEPPFDKQTVRQAVNLAVDRANLQRLEGGPVIGAIATSVLPPLTAGHLSPAEFNPFRTPGMAGDTHKARRLMARAGYRDGFDKPITVVGAAGSPYEEQLQAIRNDLEQIGFSNVKVRHPRIPRYLEAGAQITMGTAGRWCGDYNDAVTFMRPLFYGGGFRPGRNYNYAQLDDPRLNELIDEAAATPHGAERTRRWEEANKLATLLAAWVPISWDKSVIVYGNDLTNVVYNAFLAHIDWVVVGVKPAAGRSEGPSAGRG